MNEGQLYVQDGPVTSSWSLTDDGPNLPLNAGHCVSAINLVTLKTATPSTAAPSSDPFADVYETPATATATYSAPVIRQHQIQGAPGGLVFVLGSDGSIHALDNGLAHVSGPTSIHPRCLR